MISINSSRAKKLLESPRFVKETLSPQMKRYPGDEFVLWVFLEWDQNNVKNLSFYGNLEDHQKVLFESMASLLIGKPISRLDDLSLRELEAFLRDRNTEISIDGLTASDEAGLKKVLQWIRAWPRLEAPKEFNFSSEKGPFSGLKLVDKIREIKAFLNSPEILELYRNHARPELVDLEDLTVYIHAPYRSEEERGLFEELHLLGVEAFQEENLNFIPEA